MQTGKFKWRWLPLILGAWVVAGCGPAPIVTGDVSERADIAVDSYPDAPADVVQPCPGSTVRCGSTCVDLRTDPAHCGVCTTTCAGAERCAAGVCGLVCPTGQTACGSECVTLGSDRQNCGACGSACPAGQVCSVGACAASC
ncbi:MAG: hypothetical protein WCJ30_26100, partial [Deltaproteobacteria bacterium]